MAVPDVMIEGEKLMTPFSF